MNSRILLSALLVSAGVAGSASAAEILVTADISTSTTWTANNTYNLQQQIYVLPGATLTIEPGTVIGEDPELDAQRFFRSPSGVVLVTRRMLANL